METREKLTPVRITQSALHLLDTQGEKVFSMRKLATELDVDPMAIYHHHANKAALLHAVLQMMMEDCDIPATSGDWQQDLRNLCYAFRSLARKHPGAFQVYETYDRRLPADHRLHEPFHTTLKQAGFTPRNCVQAVRMLLAYTEGFAVDEISGWFDPVDRMELSESLSEGHYPTLTSLITEITTTNADADFDFGLTVLIRGLDCVRG